MIITQKKPMEELLAMLEGVKKAAIVGCANCATACQTGGEKEIQELKATLEAQGIEVVATVLPTNVATRCWSGRTPRSSGTVAQRPWCVWPAATVCRPWQTT